MADDPDIWRAASLLVKRHGADVAINKAADIDGLAQLFDRFSNATVECLTPR